MKENYERQCSFGLRGGGDGVTHDRRRGWVAVVATVRGYCDRRVGDEIVAKGCHRRGRRQRRRQHRPSGRVLWVSLGRRGGGGGVSHHRKRGCAGRRRSRSSPPPETTVGVCSSRGIVIRADGCGSFRPNTSVGGAELAATAMIGGSGWWRRVAVVPIGCDHRDPNRPGEIEVIAKGCGHHEKR